MYIYSEEQMKRHIFLLHYGFGTSNAFWLNNCHLMTWNDTLKNLTLGLTIIKVYNTLSFWMVTKSVNVFEQGTVLPNATLNAHCTTFLLPFSIYRYICLQRGDEETDLSISVAECTCRPIYTWYMSILSWTDYVCVRREEVSLRRPCIYIPQRWIIRTYTKHSALDWRDQRKHESGVQMCPWDKFLHTSILEP